MRSAERAGNTKGPEQAIWEEFAAPLRAFVRRRVPAEIDAEDVVQDIFLRILRNLPSLATVERVDAWVFQVARTAVADALRGHRRRDARTDDVDPDTISDPDAEESSAVAELTPCMTPFVKRLEEPYRRALELTALGGMSQVEAAKLEGISFSGFKSRVQRAREQLRQLVLRCCELQMDARGGLMDYEVRDPSVCGPAPASLTPIRRLQK